MPESSPFDQVLCAIDGSDEALNAAYRGWCLAPGAPLTLVHVVDLIDAPADEGVRPAWVHEQRRKAEVVLADARDQLVACGVGSAVDLEVDEGARPDLFRDMTGDGARQLLTMGSGEQTEVSSGPAVDLPPPSVDRLTRRVLDVAGCSVLINRLGPRSEPWPQSITVGVDGSPASTHAYETAVALAKLTGGTVTAVTAVEHRFGRRKPTWQANVPASARVVKGEPPDAALIKMEWRSDLVVVGRIGGHRSRGMGTTSERVATFSPVPVLVVYRPEQT